MPLIQMAYRSEHTNIYFRGFRKDGRPVYEVVDKATGKRKRLVISKSSYAAMNKVMREYGNVLKSLAD